MDTNLYVEDVIVPLISIPKDRENLFIFRGSGFYIDSTGFLITCRHVVDQVTDIEYLAAYQTGKKRTMPLKIVDTSARYDLAVCKSDDPGISDPWPFVLQPFVRLGDDVEIYAYCNEPVGYDQLPFRPRYMKGHITGFSRDANCPDSYELSFPVLSGMSGAPLIRHFPVEGQSKRRTGIVGFAYGSRESEIVKHTKSVSLDFEERVSRIQELGLAYKAEVFAQILDGTGVTVECFSE
jgi:hypothetical protein